MDSYATIKELANSGLYTYEEIATLFGIPVESVPEILNCMKHDKNGKKSPQLCSDRKSNNGGYTQINMTVPKSLMDQIYSQLPQECFANHKRFKEVKIWILQAFKEKLDRSNVGQPLKNDGARGDRGSAAADGNDDIR
jgi:hypothetical protein